MKAEAEHFRRTYLPLLRLKGEAFMRKRLLTAFVSLAMLFALIPVAGVTSHAAKEGMWTTYCMADEYYSEDTRRPEPGYEYTSEGFSVISPDYRGTYPSMTVVSKEAQPVKDGIYLEFRVDDYAYGGDRSYDHWIALSLSTEEKFSPGSTKYGGGWLELLRGDGNGVTTASTFTTDPEEGSFMMHGNVDSIYVPTDGADREIYTLEINWNGSSYEIKINGVVRSTSNEVTKLLEKLDPRGEFYVGIAMHSVVSDSSASLTILKYGTCEADAVTPEGDDSKSPEENYIYQWPIQDSSTVERNTPAILWNPDTYTLKSGHNCTMTVTEDNAWRVTATDYQMFFNLKPKSSWSYDAEDFPVFGILFRNLWVDSGMLWYSAGEYAAPADGNNVYFTVYDGGFYGEDDEYIFVPVDLSDLWEGRINGIRIDMQTADSFDICFAGIFRSTDEAYAYAEAYLGIDDGVHETWIEETEPREPDTREPDVWETDAPYEPETHYHETTGIPDPFKKPAVTTAPVDPVPDTDEPVTKRPPKYEDDDDDDDEGKGILDILAEYGCAGTLSGGALLLIAAAAFVVSKRKY